MQNPGEDVHTGVVMLDRPDEYEDEILERALRDYIVEQTGDFGHAMPMPEPVRWPTPGAEPINEFTTEGYIAMTFPTLFASGEADFRDNTHRVEPLGLAEYFECLLRYKDGRFGRHPR